MQFWALIIDSLRESLDRKTFWLLVCLTLFVALLMLCVGFGPDRVSLLFGLWEPETDSFNPLSDIGRSRIVGLVVYGLMENILGLIGVTLMIIATAGMFPAIMEGGQIDVLLGKPLTRAKLFLYKYVAGMAFVLVQATLFVGLTFLVMGLRWGVWSPGYLLSIPLLVLLFSYIYCVSVFVAVHLRSTVAAILVSIAAWIIFAVVHQTPQLFDEFPSLQRHAQLDRVVRIVSWVPPKTGDVTYLAARWANAGTSAELIPQAVADAGTEADRERMGRARQVEEGLLGLDPVRSIGSSLLFEAVVVLLAWRRFSRQDF